MVLEIRKKQTSAREYETAVRTTCGNLCHVGCGMKVFVEGGRIVDVYGDEEHPLNKGALCPRGATAYQEVYNPARLLHPMIRNSLGEELKLASWEDAVRCVASRIRAIRQEHGPSSVHLHLSPWASFGSAALGDRFGRLFGARRFGGFAPPADTSAYAAARRIFGAGSPMNPPQDWPNSGCILVVGSGISSEVILGGWILDARDRGTEVIWISTTRSPLTAKATLPIVARPGTETMVLMSMLNVLIGEGLYDRGFVQRWVLGLDELRDVCRSYTPECTEEITWVPAATTRAAAHALAARHPCQVVGGLNDPRDSEVYGLALASAALVALSGSVGVKGGGWNWLWCGQPTFEAASRDLPRPRDVAGESPPPAMGGAGRPAADSRHHQGRAFIVDGDFASGSGTPSFAADVLRDSELTVLLAAVPGEQSRYAHVVLPAATWLEEDGLMHHTHHRSLQWRNRAVLPPPDCKSVADFWVALAGEFGWGALFPWRKADGSVDQRQLADYFLRREPLLAGCSVDAIDPEINPPGGMMWPCPREAAMEEGATIRGEWILYREGCEPTEATRRFPSRGGKIELPAKELRRLARRWSPRGQTIEDPETAVRFPLVLATASRHGAFGPEPGRWPWTAGAGGERAVYLHPMVASLARVRPGDLVTLEYRDGAVQVPVVADATLFPKCAWCPGGSPLGIPDGTRVRLFKEGQDPDATARAIAEVLQGVSDGRRISGPAVSKGEAKHGGSE